MKNLIFKNKLFVVIWLIVLSFSFQSCGDDSEDLKTFLEKYGNTTWKFNEVTAGGILYAKINNIQSNPFEIWISLFDNSCFIYESLGDDGTVEVLENSENKLEIKIIDNAQEYSIITLTIVGDTLTASNEDFEDGVSVDKNTFILLRTSDDVDNLELCVL